MARLPKRKFAILMSYAGTGYHGMQINQLTPTIELAVLKAFRKSQLISSENWPLSLQIDNNDGQAPDLVQEADDDDQSSAPLTRQLDATKEESKQNESMDVEVDQHPTKTIMETCNKISFQRSCRTDKGVHAARQLIAATLCIPNASNSSDASNDDQEDLVISDETLNEVNSNLPSTIRIWSFHRVTRRFHAKNMCSGRIYEYLLPTSILQPDNDEKNLMGGTPPTMESILERRELEAKMSEMQKNGEEIERPFSERPQPRSQEEIESDKTFRISEGQLERIRNILSQFVGTHNYHNYTIGRPHWEASSMRHITSFVASDPFMIESNEWISIKVSGASFMLHQIRKMVGMLILMMRCPSIPVSFISQTYGACRLNIPKAPGLGLLLDEPLFKIYNSIVDKKKDTEPGFKAIPITFDDHAETIEKFKHDLIYSAIYKEAIAEDTFHQWLASLYPFKDEFAYLRPDGSIPSIFFELANEGRYNKNDPKNVERAQQNRSSKRVVPGKPTAKQKRRRDNSE